MAMGGSIGSTNFWRRFTSNVATFPGRGLWLALTAVAVTDTMWLAMSRRLSLDPWSALPLIPIVVLLPLMAAYCASRTDERLQRLAAPFMGVLFIALAFSAMRVLDHLTMSLSLPWADAELAHLDAALGFDWLGYAEWVSRRPLEINSFHLAYTGLTLVALSVFVLLFAAGGREQAQEFLRLVFWTGLAATVLGSLLPAKDAMAMLAPASLQATFGPGTGVVAVPYLAALRAGTPHVLNLGDLPGLVTMPSYHTACALLIAYGCRRVRLLNIGAVVYAAVMIASTPIMGGHYFVDLIGGALLVVAVIIADNRIRYFSGTRPAGMPVLGDSPTIAPKGHHEVPVLQSPQRAFPGGDGHRRLEQLAASPDRRA